MIGGNTEAIIQIRKDGGTNEIGQKATKGIH